MSTSTPSLLNVLRVRPIRRPAGGSPRKIPICRVWPLGERFQVAVVGRARCFPLHAPDRQDLALRQQRHHRHPEDRDPDRQAFPQHNLTISFCNMGMHLTQLASEEGSKSPVIPAKAGIHVP